jgi:hypothetical protein
MTIAHLIPGIRSFRAFLPAKEFKTSLCFYEALGFEAYKLGDTLAELSLGPHAFLLHQEFLQVGQTIIDPAADLFSSASAVLAAQLGRPPQSRAA